MPVFKGPVQRRIGLIFYLPNSDYIRHLKTKPYHMATTADIKNGLCIEFNNDIYQFVEFQHVKPGKGNAFVRCRMKGLRTGRMLEHTFPAGHDITTARVVRRPYQFLYKDDTGYNFMDNETFEQIALQEATIDAPQYLKEGQEVGVLINTENDSVLGAELPDKIVLQVTYTEPGLRGDTATRTLKPATLETGATLGVPLFVNEGELIRINTKTGEYVERVKE